MPIYGRQHYNDPIKNSYTPATQSPKSSLERRSVFTSWPDKSTCSAEWDYLKSVNTGFGHNTRPEQRNPSFASCRPGKPPQLDCPNKFHLSSASGNIFTTYKKQYDHNKRWIILYFIKNCSPFATLPGLLRVGTNDRDQSLCPRSVVCDQREFWNKQSNGVRWRRFNTVDEFWWWKCHKSCNQQH